MSLQDCANGWHDNDGSDTCTRCGEDLNPPPHTIKIVFGDTAASFHQDGASDEKVEEYGSIETFSFSTEAELVAFRQGIEAMEGWMGWTEYQPRPTGEESEETI